MNSEELHDVFVGSTDVERAISTPTEIEADELEDARRDDRWRDFCLNAEHYVAETTRGPVRRDVEQPA